MKPNITNYSYWDKTLLSVPRMDLHWYCPPYTLDVCPFPARPGKNNSPLWMSFAFGGPRLWACVTVLPHSRKAKFKPSDSTNMWQLISIVPSNWGLTAARHYLEGVRVWAGIEGKVSKSSANAELWFFVGLGVLSVREGFHHFCRDLHSGFYSVREG